MTLLGMALAWPDLVANQTSLAILATFLILGGLAARHTPIDRSLMRGAALVRARRLVMSAFTIFAAALTFSAAATAWNPTVVGVVGGVGLIVSGLAVVLSLEHLEDERRKELSTMPPPVDLNLRAFNIDQLEVTNPPHSSGTNGGLRLYRAIDKNILALPRGSVAANVLKHNGQTLAKLVSPDRDNNSAIRGRRVAILGLDTTRTPFLLELPPEYVDRSIEDCELWLLQARKDDEIIAS